MSSLYIFYFCPGLLLNFSLSIWKRLNLQWTNNMYCVILTISPVITSKRSFIIALNPSLFHFLIFQLEKYWNLGFILKKKCNSCCSICFSIGESKPEAVLLLDSNWQFYFLIKIYLQLFFLHIKLIFIPRLHMHFYMNCFLKRASIKISPPWLININLYKQDLHTFKFCL